MAGFCELAIGLRAPKLAAAGAKSPIVSSGYLKYSRFWETATGDRVRSGLRGRSLRVRLSAAMPEPIATVASIIIQANVMYSSRKACRISAARSLAISEVPAVMSELIHLSGLRVGKDAEIHDSSVFWFRIALDRLVVSANPRLDEVDNQPKKCGPCVDHSPGDDGCPCRRIPDRRIWGRDFVR